MENPIFTTAQMRAYEAEAVARGIPFLQLMENAGHGAARDILRRFPAPARALVVCGKGNNGGDGLVVARLLAQAHWQVDVLLALGDNLSDLSDANRRRLPFAPLPQSAPALSPDSPPTLIIDALFGTGFHGKLPENLHPLMRALNRAEAVKIALDMLSGLNADSGEADSDTFRAHLTYAFAARKPAHLPATAWCGEVVCIAIAQTARHDKKLLYEALYMVFFTGTKRFLR